MSRVKSGSRRFTAPALAPMLEAFPITDGRKEEYVMNVNGVGGGVPPQQADNSVSQSRMQQAFTPVAQLFGESSNQLMQELQSGKASLTDLAKAKGISQDDLVNAIKQGISQTSNSSAPALNDTQLTNIATRIANHKHGGHRHHQAQSAGGAKGHAAGSVAL